MTAEAAAPTPGVVELTVTQVRDDLAPVVSRAQYAGGITYMTRHGKRAAAIVPAEAAELLERLQAAEDAEDIRDARKALTEIAAGAPTTPWSTLRAELLAEGE